MITWGGRVLGWCSELNLVGVLRFLGEGFGVVVAVR